MSGNVHANRSTDPLTCIQHRVLKLERFVVDNFKFKIPKIAEHCDIILDDLRACIRHWK